MSPQEHRQETERLLQAAKKGHVHLASQGSTPVHQVQADLQVIEQQIALAHVHALLADGRGR